MEVSARIELAMLAHATDLQSGALPSGPETKKGGEIPVKETIKVANTFTENWVTTIEVRHQQALRSALLHQVSELFPPVKYLRIPPM